MRCLQVCTLAGIFLMGLTPFSATPPLPQVSLSHLCAQAMNFTVQGKIIKQIPGKLTINTEENILFHVRYDDKTDIRKSDGTSATAKDLRVGVVVSIDGELTESGEILAARIEIQKA
jgi:hypothetical protein